VSTDVARAIRERLNDARALAGALQLPTAPRASARQAFVCCPWHQENSPSCSLKLREDGTISVHCFGCDQRGDAYTLIAKVRGLDLVGDFQEVLRAAADIANAPALAPVEVAAKPVEHEGVNDETYHGIWSWLLEALSPLRAIAPQVANYLDGRCIGADAEAVGVRGLPRDGRELAASCLAVFERADLEGAGVLRQGLDTLDWPAWRVLVPWRDRYGRITCVQRRRLDDGRPKYLSPKGRSPRAPFGVELLAGALDCMGPRAEVIVTEGAFAALARRKIARHGDERAAVIGVYSASTAAAGMPMDLLEGRRVVLSLDRDGAGESAREKLAALIEPVAGEIVHERTQGAAVDAGDVLEAAS
jgi:DNA primase